MIKYVCDRCGKELDKSYRARICYSGNNEADFCKECNEEFLRWMQKEPIKDCDEQERIEYYVKAIHNYKEQIANLTEILDKTKASRDWWSNTCTEIFKDYNALHEKIEKKLTGGNVDV